MIEDDVTSQSQLASFHFQKPTLLRGDDLTDSTCTTCVLTEEEDVVEYDEKKIRFAEALNEYCEPEHGSLTTEEKEAVWYTDEEYRTFRGFCKHMTIKARHSEYMTDFELLYRACVAEDTKPLQELTKICRASVRGLEVMIHPLTVTDRKYDIRRIVETQYEIIDETVEDQSLILATMSRKQSRRSRLMARVFGNGDADVARQCYLRPWQLTKERAQK